MVAKYYDINFESKRTYLGSVGYFDENEYRALRVDVSSVLADYPNAAFRVAFQRAKDTHPYEKNLGDVTLENNKLVVVLKEVDYNIPGRLQIQITFESGSVTGKSGVFLADVGKSLSSDTNDPKSPYADALAEIDEALEKIDEFINTGGGSIALDKTLTAEGKAADAKAVGDALNALEEKIPDGNDAVELDTTLTQSGKAADAWAVGNALAALEGKIPESDDSDFVGYAGISYYDNGEKAFPPIVHTAAHDARCAKVSAYMQGAAEDALLASTEGVMAHECALFDTYMTWVENVAGTTADVPSDTGVTAVKGRVYNIGGNINFPSALPNFPNDTVTVIAQKGDEAINTVTGETFNIQGGVGYQTGIDGKVLCGYVPVYGKLAGLTCTISTSANTITVTSRDTWTLTIDGELGEYEYSRLPSGLTGATLHPSNQVAKIGSTYYRADVVPNNGFVVCSSTDLINWTYIGHATFPAGFDDHSATEACCGEKRNRLYVAVRQKAESACLFLAKMNTDMCTVNSCVALPDCGSKPTFSTAVRMPDNTYALYLATAPADRYGCRVYCIPTDYAMTHIYPAFDLHGVACNYPHIMQIGTDPTWLLIAGTNGSQSDKKGVSLVPAAVFPKIVGQVKMPEATENIVQLSDGVRTFGDLYGSQYGETGSGNQPLIFTGAVEATYDGTEAVTIDIPSGGSGGVTWENVANETLEAEATGFTTVTFETARKISRIRAYMEIVGTPTNTSNSYMHLLINDNIVACTPNETIVSTDGTIKYSFFDVELTASGVWSKGFTQNKPGDTWTSQTCNDFKTTVNDGTEISTILVQTRRGWATLGVGSKLVLDVC